MSGEQIFYVAIAGIISGVLVVAVPVLANYYRQIQRDASLVELKLELARQQYSADEIIRIVESGQTPDRSDKLASQSIS